MGLGRVSPDFASRFGSEKKAIRSPRQRQACFFCYSPCAPCLPCPPCLPTMPAYQPGSKALPQLLHLIILARIHFPCVLGHRHFLTRIFFTACLLSSWPCIYLKTSIYLSTHAIASYPLLLDMILRMRQHADQPDLFPGLAPGEAADLRDEHIEQ